MNRKFFCLNDKKYLERSSATAFFAMRPDSKTVYWVDITQPDPASLTEFLSPLQLHPLILDECLDPAAGSHIAPYEESLFVRLLIQPGRDNRSQSYLSIICLPHSVITVHDSPVAALKCIETKFSTGVRFHSLSTSDILYQIFDHLIDENMVFVLEARRTIESLDEAIDRKPGSVQIDQILALKRTLAHLSIIFEDQHYCLTTLQTIESDFFDVTHLREYFRDSLSHLEYVLRSVGRQQAHLSELHQHYLITLQEKTNKRLRLLTIISAVFMPLTFITGIYGMNFRHMPELAWRFGYPLAIIVMLLLAGGLLWVFYRKGWFK